MGLISTLLGLDDWDSGYNDGWADAKTGKDYGQPACDNDQGHAGYAYGYGDGQQDQPPPAGW
jgi:hypothetical protein